jgi:type II secretory pathway predicted ATPase ExeA
MPEKGFAKFMGIYPKAVQNYCNTLEWDPEKFKTSISDEGISHPDLYLEDPNIGIIDKLSQFLEPTNQSSVFIIWDDVGMGKSSIRDFVSQSLNEFDNYHVAVMTDPRLSSLQILRIIAKEIGAEADLWNDRGSVKEALWERLEDITEKGLSLIIWVDEAEKVTREIISELRALSDLKTSDGTKMCKLILSGTPSLMKKIEDFIRTDPEDAAAFDDRASLNTFSLHKWTEMDIFNYWKLLADYCGNRNPFTKDAARTVFRISEGKPRTIAQVTKLAFYAKAVEHLNEEGNIDITSQHVLGALKDTLGGENAQET